jgi:hypothetical protein
MVAAKLGLIVLGSLSLLIGFIWVGQGFGNYPNSDTIVVVDQSVWIGRGVVALLAGLALLVWSELLQRRQR